MGAPEPPGAVLPAASPGITGRATFPAVSIIVPVYNVAEHVGAAIDSLRAQTFTDFEAIVIDDGSTDDSDLRAREAAKGDDRFVFLRQTNAGLSAARNTGLSAARAPVIGFLDSDDSFDPAFLSTLMRALDQSRAPWAACAVQIVSPERTHVSSAIHGATHPAAQGRWTAYLLDDWAEIVRHWPSAWNKLYRRELIDGLQFPNGLAYEDHVWFQQVAERAVAMAYVPEPLYRHTRGREGQITSDGSDRVYQQFEVLDAVRQGLDTSFKKGAARGLARLATRTIHERAATQREPERRARFVDTARRFLAHNSLRWTPEWDRAISHSFADVLAGRLPLTVVVATDGIGSGLRRSLHSLETQYLTDLEVLIVPTVPGLEAWHRLQAMAGDLPTARVLSGGTGCVAEARNRGLAEAQGLFAVVLDAGDSYAPGALWLWVEAMIREKADLGLSRFSQAAGHVHPGTHDGRDPFGKRWPSQSDPLDQDWLKHIEGSAGRVPATRAPLLHAHPSAKIFRTAFLRASGLRFAPEPFGSWGLTLAAALKAPKSVAIPPLGLHVSDAAIDRRLWRGCHGVEDIQSAMMAFAPTLDAHLPRDAWYPRLLARALWEKSRFGDFPTGALKTAFMRDAGALIARTCPTQDPDLCIDPFIDRNIRVLFPAYAEMMR